MQDVKQLQESLEQEIARQVACGPQCLSEREALQLASVHSVSRALLLLSRQLSQSVMGSGPLA